MREIEIARGGRVLRVRDAGDPEGAVVVCFHGTASSRLELCLGEELAAGRGVRLVSFDRPGFGGSTPAPFGLASIAADAHAIADELGVARFATLGHSGGGAGALAAATVPGGRVIRVGIAGGVGPYQLVPGALDDLDRAALLLLPGDRAAAAVVFAAGVEPLAELARQPGSSMAMAAWADLPAADRELLEDQRYASAFADTIREGLRPGTSGPGWDFVSFVGEWDIDLSAVGCPVLLWYGSQDHYAPHGVWLSEHLPRARLAVHDGEGRFTIYEHLGEYLGALTEPDA